MLIPITGVDVYQSGTLGHPYLIKLLILKGEDSLREPFPHSPHLWNSLILLGSVWSIVILKDLVGFAHGVQTLSKAILRRLLKLFAAIKVIMIYFTHGKRPGNPRLIYPMGLYTYQ